jgi:hypothetical protein
MEEQVKTLEKLAVRGTSQFLSYNKHDYDNKIKINWAGHVERLEVKIFRELVNRKT